MQEPPFLLICGVRGYLIEYSSGDCRHYKQWLLADRGVKKEMTTLSPEAYEKILGLLDSRAFERGEMGRPRYRRFRREGNV